MATLKNRLEALESRTGGEQHESEIIVVMSEGRDLEDIQTLGMNALRRAAGESANDFIDRVAAHIAPGRENAGPAIMLAGFADDD